MRVFFSFAYTEDHHRAKIVMDNYLSHSGATATGFISDSEIDNMCAQGLEEVYRWIEQEVQQASAVAVLIGTKTAGRHFVEYEIAQAQKRRKPIVGVYIDGLADQNGNRSPRGENPLFPVFPTYDYILDGGEKNLPSWLQQSLLKHSNSYTKLGSIMTDIAQKSRAARK